MRSTTRGVPEEHRARWVQTYAETHYAELPWFSARPSPWVATAVRQRWWRPGGRILDVGCGAGTNALFLARRGYRATGVDLADGAIAAAKERARKARLTVDFRVADALDLPFPAASFDGASDFGCFHTIPAELRKGYARELARVLRPGASFALSWVAREYQRQPGPPHRLSLDDVTSALEKEFLFLRTEHRPDAPRRQGPGTMALYDAKLERRRAPQPPAV